MMHFTIPETIERRDTNGTPYTSFEVHLNGVHHCSVRYRQLHNLHQQLRKEFQQAALPIPTFPPKKMLILSQVQVEERRFGLERYLQLISQDPRLSQTLTFNGFLLASQQETHADPERTNEVDLDVYLMNDQKITIRGWTVLQTQDVIEKVCSQLGILESHASHFGLFLVQRAEGNILSSGVVGNYGENIQSNMSSNHMTLVKKLQDFESPYISLKSHPISATGQKLKLVLRKACWDSRIDGELFKHKGSLNVLYFQTLSDVERGWIVADSEIRKQLGSMQARGAKLDYMETARNLKDYGYIHFSSCFCDYPATNTRVSVLIGARELVLRTPDPQNGDNLKEGRFKVTRMRCWRIMSPDASTVNLLQNRSNGEDENHFGRFPTCSLAEPALELSFEYLMPNNRDMQWISITSPQAILMSLCLQSIVEELLWMKANDKPGSKLDIERLMSESSPKLKTNSRQYNHKRQDGLEVLVPVRIPVNEASAQNIKIQPENISQNKKIKSSMGIRQYSVKSLSKRFDVVNMKEAARAAEDVLIENVAFQELSANGDSHDQEWSRDSSNRGLRTYNSLY